MWIIMSMMNLLNWAWTFCGERCSRRVKSTGKTRRSLWDDYTEIWCFSVGGFCGVAPAKERNNCGLGNFGFADRTFLLWLLILVFSRDDLGVKPFVYAGPAVEVTTEGNHWILHGV
ncbi:hypothetical protein OIU78_023064 [Salix suchowensis]|nr:hypothetical protein OIU78_023064 [Salix suchowensis]